MHRSVALLLLTVAVVSSLPTKSKKKNILFLMCDSMDGRVLDPTSPVWDRVEMPNLRALAASGTNFVRTYAESPQCVPSRASMFTGRYTHEIKAWSNEMGVTMVPKTNKVDKTCKNFYGEKTCRKWGEAANVTETLVDAMEDQGYFMNLYGKVDVGAGILDRANQGNATVAGFHSGPALNICTRTADIRKPTKPSPIKITNDFDNNVHPEDWAMVDQCVKFLAAQDTVGWMLYCSVNIPHPAFNTNATWLGYVNDSAIPLPTWIPEDQMHPADSYMSQSKAVWSNFTAAEIQKVRRTYYAMCAETDFLMGRVLRALQSTGQYEDTFIIFLSDHGEMNMEHRQVWKNSMYEASERVPMMVAGPGIKKGKVVTSLTSLLDVFPTLVDMAGGTPGSQLRGQSLMPLLTGGQSDATEQDRFVTAQYHSNMGNTGSFMVRWQQWKYIVFGTTLKAFKGYKPQLFDVHADPEELHDVAEHNPDVVSAMDAKLRSKYNYEAVDRECKANDYMIYKTGFGNESKDRLQKQLRSAYTGFDSTDMQKFVAWEAEASKI